MDISKENDNGGGGGGVGLYLARVVEGKGS